MISCTRLPARSRSFAACSLLVSLAAVCAAQTSAPPTAAPSDDAVVRLNPFEVTGSTTHGYRATNSISGTAMNTPLRDVPMNISVVTNELLSDMLVGNMNRALDFTSSVTQQARQPINNRVSIFTLRGFRVRNLLVDGVPAGDYVPPYFVDRIEVVKGPNTIYGQTDPGGIINIISKRPMGNSFANIETRFGNNGLLEAEADANAAITKELQLRVVGGYREWDGFRWADGSEQTFFGVAGTYHLGKDTEFTFHASENDLAGVSSSTSTYSFEIIPTDVNGDGRIDGTNVGGVIENQARYNSSFLPREWTSATPADRFRQRSRYLQGGLRHTFNPNIRAQYQFVNSKQNFAGTFREFNTFSAAGVSAVNHNYNERENITDAHTLNMLFDFKTGEMSHRLMAGARYSKDLATNPDNFWRLRGDNAAERAVLQQMINSGRRIRLQLTKAEVLAGTPIWTEDLPTAEEIRVLGSRGANIADATEEVRTFYVTDSVSLLEGRLRLLGGIREVQIESSSRNLNGALAGPVNDKSDTTFQAGGIYDLAKSVSLYVNYATAFTPNSLDTRTNTFFPAEDADAYEAGLKFDGLWDGRVAGAFSAFEIEKRNVVRRDFNPATFTFDPEITDDRSRGLELDLFFNLERWNSILSYTYLDAKVVKSQSSAAGMRLESAAPHRFTFWTSYDLGAVVKGLRFGGGIVWADGPIQQFGTSNSRLVVEDGYTEVSLFARYATRLWERKVEFGVNVANLTDEFYMRARAAVADPRQIVFSVNVEL